MSRSPRVVRKWLTILSIQIVAFVTSTAWAQTSEVIWWEAERPIRHTFPASNAFRPANLSERDVLSGGDWLQTDRAGGARASWRVRVSETGTYQLWVRKFWKHGPFRWRFDRQPWQTCGRDVVLADAVALRTHVVANWVYLGEVELEAGDAVLWIEMMPDATAAAFDCWMLTQGVFVPNGKLRPGQVTGRSDPGYVPFEPAADAFEPTPLDLRSRNHETAGDHGFVIPQGDGFIYDGTGEAARFWGVNLGITDANPSNQRYVARRLAKLGVNLARFHGAVWDQRADVIDRDHIENLVLTAEVLAEEGIYSSLSFYFPLWLRLNGDPRFEGYGEETVPFAVLFVDRAFQEQHRAWMKALLTTPSPVTGRTLAENPAVAILEIQNEDSLLFWTFNPYETIPASTTHQFEEAFGRWLTHRYGSIQKAFETWQMGTGEVRGDDLHRARVGLYSAGFLTSQDWARGSRNERRASDQLAFFLDLQSAFYRETTRYLREELNLRCSIVATNWVTADDPYLLPIEKLSNGVTGTFDRHGYFSGRHEGEGASYSVRTDHIYENQSAIGTQIPVMARPEFGDAPHVISEYSYPVPNTARAESVFLTAGYGKASGLDAVMFFSFGSFDWEKQLGKFSAFTPAVAGQFPAASLIFREDLVHDAPVVLTEYLSTRDLLSFRGSQLARPADLDALRAIGPRAVAQIDRSSLTGIATMLGRARILPGAEESRLVIAEDAKSHRSDAGQIASVNGELVTDLARRVTMIDTPGAQGVCGYLGNAGRVQTSLVAFDIKSRYASAMMVPLDGRPLEESEQILLQIMTEETNYGWKSEPAGDGGQRIESLGSFPIQFREVRGSVRLRFGDGRFRVTELDPNGKVIKQRQTGSGEISLASDVIYTLIEPIR